MFRVPYRWLPRTFFTNIDSMWYDLWHGVYNLWRWLPLIWFDEDYDWSDLAVIMEIKFRRLADCLENGHHLDCERDAKHARICAALLKRMIDGETGYYKRARRRQAFKSDNWGIHVGYMEKQDERYLGMMIGKYLTSLWD